MANSKEAGRVLIADFEHARPHNMIEKIIAYEEGDMDNEQTVEFFQELIDSGLAWTLQGHYGRAAAALIRTGHCHAAVTERG